tara:strand:- start:25 stop:429 length:405 start_codon:yes stop_codon:yes gene_type:complete
MESGLYKKYIGSPCKKNGIDPKLIVDSVKKAAFDKDFNKLQTTNKTKDVDLNDSEQYRGEYKSYVKNKKEGYVQDNSDDGMPNVNIPADPSSTMDYNKFSTSKEIARGGKRAVKALEKQQMVNKTIKAGKSLKI